MHLRVSPDSRSFCRSQSVVEIYQVLVYHGNKGFSVFCDGEYTSGRKYTMHVSNWSFQIAAESECRDPLRKIVYNVHGTFLIVQCLGHFEGSEFAPSLMVPDIEYSN